MIEEEYLWTPGVPTVTLYYRGVLFNGKGRPISPKHTGRFTAKTGGMKKEGKTKGGGQGHSVI